MPRDLTIGLINRSKYAQPPSWDQIHELITEMKMDMYSFERFYGIPYNTLTQIKTGKRTLAADYWHFIYEKIKPAYGAGFVVDYSKKRTKNRIKHHLTSNLIDESDGDAHSRIDGIK